eukprot:CAMPEP_0117617644 /NCGR_PEP_ID=MMETSP0784-20121206/85696_1 /TAXON_ID=39447 /ORGANISM="" /LENGTH=78 /DNA_ID=CAMNT_0005421487 /DNA_START=1007 /DNA_END=1243 /DNA_ORIENTATION=-
MGVVRVKSLDLCRHDGPKDLELLVEPIEEKHERWVDEVDDDEARVGECEFVQRHEEKIVGPGEAPANVSLSNGMKKKS